MDKEMAQAKKNLFEGTKPKKCCICGSMLVRSRLTTHTERAVLKGLGFSDQKVVWKCPNSAKHILHAREEDSKGWE